MGYKAIAKLDQLIEGKIHIFSTRNFDIALVNRNGNIYAFEDICSHDGGNISEGVLDGEKVICPRHFAEFDILTGKPLCMPATQAIAIFPVRIMNGMVEVLLEEN